MIRLTIATFFIMTVSIFGGNALHLGGNEEAALNQAFATASGFSENHKNAFEVAPDQSAEDVLNGPHFRF